jgi:hypothetical protein
VRLRAAQIGQERLDPRRPLCRGRNRQQPWGEGEHSDEAQQKRLGVIGPGGAQGGAHLERQQHAEGGGTHAAHEGAEPAEGIRAAHPAGRQQGHHHGQEADGGADQGVLPERPGNAEAIHQGGGQPDAGHQRIDPLEGLVSERQPGVAGQGNQVQRQQASEADGGKRGAAEAVDDAEPHRSCAVGAASA